MTANEKQKRNCLNCHFNPMTDTEFAAARITGGINFICGYNGVFQVSDMNFWSGCRQFYKKSLLEQESE